MGVGLNPVDLLSRYQNPPVETPAKTNQPPAINQEPEYKLNGNFGWNVGGVSGVNPATETQGVSRVIDPSLYTTGIDGSPIAQGTQGVGLGINMKEGADSHYDSLYGHAQHTKWLVA